MYVHKEEYCAGPKVEVAWLKVQEKFGLHYLIRKYAHLYIFLFFLDTQKQNGVKSAKVKINAVNAVL